MVAHAEQGDGAKTYSDFDDRYNWVLDNRARAFKRQYGVTPSTFRVRSAPRVNSSVSRDKTLAPQVDHDGGHPKKEQP